MWEVGGCRSQFKVDGFVILVALHLGPKREQQEEQLEEEEEEDEDEDEQQCLAGHASQPLFFIQLATARRSPRSASSSVKSVTAAPGRPARPLRPMRWM